MCLAYLMQCSLSIFIHYFKVLNPFFMPACCCSWCLVWYFLILNPFQKQADGVSLGHPVVPWLQVDSSSRDVTWVWVCKQRPAGSGYHQPGLSGKLSLWSFVLVTEFLFLELWLMQPSNSKNSHSAALPPSFLHFYFLHQRQMPVTGVCVHCSVQSPSSWIAFVGIK